MIRFVTTVKLQLTDLNMESRVGEERRVGFYHLFTGTLCYI